MKAIPINVMVGGVHTVIEPIEGTALAFVDELSSWPQEEHNAYLVPREQFETLMRTSKQLSVECDEMAALCSEFNAALGSLSK